jgi:hypothetical protein
LYCKPVSNLRPLIIPLLSFFLLAIALYARLQFTASDYPFGIFKHFVRVVELNHAL